jgi:hypothetical protein
MPLTRSLDDSTVAFGLTASGTTVGVVAAFNRCSRLAC